MGIRNLNAYLRDNCADAIRCVTLDELSGKTVVVDASIYMYKFEEDGMLMENMYLMLSVFAHYRVTALFIFDGKPPAQKRDTLRQRRMNRACAQTEYDEIMAKIASNADEVGLAAKAVQLKKQLTVVCKKKIDTVKQLISAFGSTYYDAPGESDAVCASLVICQFAWACLSEDTDMFVYGCDRVLRYLSLMNHTAILYEMKTILSELDMSQDDFATVCILAGTDYKTVASAVPRKIFDVFEIFNRHSFNRSESFLKWVSENANEANIKEIRQMFCTILPDNVLADITATLKASQYDEGQIKQIMVPEGFLFA